MIKSYHVARIVSAFSLFLLTILCTATLIPVYNAIDNVEATAGTATASVLTFNSTRSTASVNLTVGDSNGTFATSGDGTNGTNEERAVFSIATNNYTGYTLTLKSSTNTTTLSNANGTISTLLSPATLSTFSADTSEGRALNNRWGYIPNYYNATGTSPVQNTTTYYPAPTTSGTTLRTTTSRNSANGEDNPDNYTIGLGLRADFTNPTGSYTNDSLILEFVANSIAYNISFADNTGDSSVTGLPSSLSNDTASTGITLPSTTPTRAGYTFDKWCLGTVSNNGSTCNGTQFGAGGSFGIDQTIDNTNLTLYAMWTGNPYAISFTFDSHVSSVEIKNSAGTSTIATISTSGNSTNLIAGTTYKIIPTYEKYYTANAISKTSGAGTVNSTNYTYTVGAGTATVNITSQAITFDIAFAEAGKSKSGGYYLMQDMGSGVCSKILPGQTSTLKDSRDQQNYTVAKIGDSCYMTQNLAITGTIPAEGSNFTGSSITPDYTDYTYFASSYSGNKVVVSDSTYGVFYNYCMASAGTNCSNIMTTLTSDICPANWRMPTSNSITELRNTTDAASLFQAQLGGYFTSSSATPSATSFGWYWSSTSSSVYYPYTLRASATLLTTNSSNNKYYGESIRCVNAPEVTINITAGTGISSISIANSPVGSSFSGTYKMGDQINVAATPDTNYGKPYNWDLNGDGALNAASSPASRIYVVGSESTDIAISASPYQQVTVTAGTGVSSVSINGGTASSTVSGYYEQDNITISATTSSSATSVYSWSSTGAGTLGSAVSSNYGTTSLQNVFTVGNNSGNITVSRQSNVTTVMQNLNSSLCTTNGLVVYDNRDNEVYLVKRLADGNCWMLDNLRLDLTNSTVRSALTTSNTNVDASSLTSLLNGNRANGAQYANAAFSVWDSSNSTNVYNAAKANAESKDTQAMYNYGAGSGRMGVYYNFCAASAGSVCYDSNSGVSVVAPYDVCPKGWRMPTGGSGSTDEYGDLYTAYSNDTSTILAALSATISGYYSAGSIAGYGSYSPGGRYWTSTAIGSYFASAAVFSTNSKPNSITNDRNIGPTVRCILNS